MSRVWFRFRFQKQMAIQALICLYDRTSQQHLSSDCEMVKNIYVFENKIRVKTVKKLR